MKKLWKGLLIAVLAVSLAGLPGCFLCKWKPQVQNAMVMLGGLKDKFDVAYPAVRAVLALGFQIQLPDVETYSQMVDQAARDFMDAYNSACPNDEELNKAVAALNDVVRVQEQVNMAMKAYLHRGVK